MRRPGTLLCWYRTALPCFFRPTRSLTRPSSQACADASFDDIDRMRARLALWYAQLMSRLRNRIDRLLIDS